ncbi:MAG: hypothetical protein ACUVQG_08510 [Thermogutta sp.]
MMRVVIDKAIRDSWPQFLVSCLILFLFSWLFVWLTSLINIGLWATFFDMLPAFVRKLMPVPSKILITPTGRVSFLFVHIVPMLIFIGWAFGRASQLVSGEIAAGRCEVLLTLPVHRCLWVILPGAVFSLGAFLLAASLWLGLWMASITVPLPEGLQLLRFLPGVINLATMSVALLGITAAISAALSNRWNTIGIAALILVASMILKLIARLWQPGEWLKYLSFLTLFEPQELIFLDGSTRTSVVYNVGLIFIGVMGHVVAAAVLSFRDIPVSR